jgi:hypothetical protein
VLTSDGGQDVLNSMGFFLRALSAVYSIIDAERLAQDTATLLKANALTTVQALNFNNDLHDVINVLQQAKVSLPTSYAGVLAKAPAIGAEYQAALAHKQAAQMAHILSELQALQQSIATISPGLS